MGTATKIVIAIIVVLLLAATYPALYLYSLNTIDTQNVEFSDITFDGQGITLSGTITLQNSGIVDVTVDHVDYTITLENTNEQLGKGRIDAGIIPAGGTADLAFHKTVGWKPTIQGALSLLSARSVNLIISGEGSADFLSIPFTKTFTSTIDVKQYLENYMQKLR